jgi:hypothetical protein
LASGSRNPYIDLSAKTFSTLAMRSLEGAREPTSGGLRRSLSDFCCQIGLDVVELRLRCQCALKALLDYLSIVNPRGVAAV